MLWRDNRTRSTNQVFASRFHAHQIHGNRFDTIVIGMGAMGSAAACHLSRRGKRVLGLEQFDIPNDMGSSHGYTRIIRLAYYEHPSYVMLLQRAYELWRDIERQADEKLLHITGSLDIGPADSWVFKGSFQSCIEYELEHEVYSGLELGKRFPGYRLPHEIMALYQPQGGFLAPEKCITSYVMQAQANGAEIHGREAVEHWEPLGNGEGVRVYTNRAIYEADSLVITAGAWNDNLLDFLRGLIVPERQVLGWFQPLQPMHFQAANFPVFNMLADEGRFYGFPVHNVPGFKIGKYHHFEETGAPEELDRDVHPEDEAILRDAVARYFPDAAGPTMSLKTCMFTNAPDGHFLIDLHPDYPQVAYASACTGHGFKFASVIGEVLADLAIQQQTRHNIDLFSHLRFNSSPQTHGFGGQHGALAPTGDTSARRHALQKQRFGEQEPAHPVSRHRAQGVGNGAMGLEWQASTSVRRAQQQDEHLRSPWE